MMPTSPIGIGSPTGLVISGASKTCRRRLAWLLGRQDAEDFCRIATFLEWLQTLETSDRVHPRIAHAKLCTLALQLANGTAPDPDSADFLRVAERRGMDPQAAARIASAAASWAEGINSPSREEFLAHAGDVGGQAGRLLFDALRPTSPRIRPFAVDYGIASWMIRTALLVAMDRSAARLPVEVLPPGCSGAGLAEGCPHDRIAVFAAVSHVLTRAARHLVSARRGLVYLPLRRRVVGLALIGVAMDMITTLRKLGGERYWTEIEQSSDHQVARILTWSRLGRCAAASLAAAPPWLVGHPLHEADLQAPLSGGDDRTDLARDS